MLIYTILQLIARISTSRRTETLPQMEGGILRLNFPKNVETQDGHSKFQSGAILYLYIIFVDAFKNVQISSMSPLTRQRSGSPCYGRG